jgi:hypothetical protein
MLERECWPGVCSIAGCMRIGSRFVAATAALGGAGEALQPKGEARGCLPAHGGPAARVAKGRQHPSVPAFRPAACPPTGRDRSGRSDRSGRWLLLRHRSDRPGRPTWDAALLERFLADPEEMFPGLWMGGNGLRAAEDRAAVAAFLRTAR